MNTKTQAKHTPGPWNCYQRNFKGLVGGIVRDVRNEVICDTSLHLHPLDRRKSPEEIDANARLIAAAPETSAERDTLKEINAELLHASKVALGHLLLCDDRCWKSAERGAEALGLLDNAISKASGVRPKSIRESLVLKKK